MDLGLPSGLKWATCNVGATSETEPGLYFAWGETTGYEKTSTRWFDWENYTASDINSDLDLAHDAAHVNMGGNWRMPTKEDFEELINNTDLINGVNGVKFANKTDVSKYIFIPFSGYFDDSEYGKLNYFGENSCYITSTYFDDYFCCTVTLSYSHVQIINDYNREYGYSVRGVCQ